MAKAPSFRFAVGSPDGPRSSTWVVFTGKKTSDWYAATRVIAGVEKFSFHESGSWQHSIVSQQAHNYVADGQSRHMDIWPRPPEFVPGWTRALGIRIPTNGLRVLPGEATSRVTFVEPTTAWTTFELLQGSQGARLDALPACTVIAELPLLDGGKVIVAGHTSEPQSLQIPLDTIPDAALAAITSTTRVGIHGNDDTGTRFVTEIPADWLQPASETK